MNKPSAYSQYSHAFTVIYRLCPCLCITDFLNTLRAKACKPTQLAYFEYWCSTSVHIEKRIGIPHMPGGDFVRHFSERSLRVKFLCIYTLPPGPRQNGGQFHIDIWTTETQ